ncbi:hypothetical protein [Caballeronia arationis]|uniref:hypothetical protein n=1 Tax=Caballeronia arationis TaxID=1777142 RepID=UPI0014218F42|nr:hypothetical protein [Caballeronia arationis]
MRTEINSSPEGGVMEDDERAIRAKAPLGKCNETMFTQNGRQKKFIFINRGFPMRRSAAMRARTDDATLDAPA